MKSHRTKLHAVLLPVALAVLTTNHVLGADFVYTNNNQPSANSVGAFAVAANGALSPIAGSPFPTGGAGSGGGFVAGNTITVSGNFLYVSNNSTANISAFSIAPATGVLTPVPGSPFPIPAIAPVSISLAATPDGQFLMAGNSDGFVSVYCIAANGALALTPGPPVFAGPAAHIKVSPDGRFLAVASGAAIRMYTISAGGALTPVAGSPFPTLAGHFAGSVDITCRSLHLFVGEDTFSGGVFGPTIVDAFRIGPDGALTTVASAPFTPGVGTNSLAVALSSDDRFLFVSNQGSVSVTGFSGAVGAHLSLLTGSPFFIGFGGGAALPAGMATGRDGAFLFVANWSTVGVLSIAGNGVLTAVPGSPFSAGVAGGMLALAAYPPKSCRTPPPWVPGPAETTPP